MNLKFFLLASSLSKFASANVSKNLSTNEGFIVKSDVHNNLLSFEHLLKLAFYSGSDSGEAPRRVRKLQEVFESVAPKTLDEVKQEVDTKEKLCEKLRKFIIVKQGKVTAETCYEVFKKYNTIDSQHDMLNKEELQNLATDMGYSDPAAASIVAQNFLDFFNTNGDSVLFPSEIIKACGKGDPHFITFYGAHYSYHGACDLVLLRNPMFAFGKGMEIQIRTEHMLNNAFSFISNAAVKIGHDVLEVINDGSHLFNGVRDAPMPASLGGFDVLKSHEEHCKEEDVEKKCSQVTHITVLLAEKGEIDVKVASRMLHVEFKGSADHFIGSVGLMGTYPDVHKNGKMARDGQTLIRDSDRFGQEWQVRDYETMLFHATRFPQFPEACVPPLSHPNVEMRRLRQAENESAQHAAIEACAHVDGPELEFCIFDVMATGDYGMAATIYG